MARLPALAASVVAVTVFLTAAPIEGALAGAAAGEMAPHTVPLPPPLESEPLEPINTPTTPEGDFTNLDGFGNYDEDTERAGDIEQAPITSRSVSWADYERWRAENGLGPVGRVGAPSTDGAGMPGSAFEMGDAPALALPPARRVFVPTKLQLAIRAHLATRPNGRFLAAWIGGSATDVPRAPLLFSPVVRAGALLTPVP